MTEIADRERLAATPAHDLALSCLEDGIAAAHPERVVHDAVELDGDRLGIADTTYDLSPFDRIVVLGGGKAAAHVASAIESVLGDRLAGGVVVTDDPVPLDSVSTLPGSHPVPGEDSVASTRKLLATAEPLGEETLALGVITGGGSALMAAPEEGISLSALQETTDALLRSGATIHEINAVRKHCSAIKGGQLAATLAPATVVTLVFSDVVGNDLDVIASGPLVPDRSTYGDALAVLERYDLPVPGSVRDHLERGASGSLGETPTRNDPIFERVHTHVLADGYTALEAAAQTVRKAGYEPMILSSRLEGEARTVGENHAAIVEEMAATGNPVEPPAVLLSGGETTVSLTGDGRGGPNQEFVLAAATATNADAVIAAVDTDGIDGNSDAAGGIIDASSFDDDEGASDALARHDVASYLAKNEASILTGPTGTNVNDLRVLVVGEIRRDR